MGLIPEPGTMLAVGAARFFQGLRTGDQRALLAGAALAAFGWWRRSSPPKKTLIHRSVVRDGSSLVIRSGSDQSAVEVRRIET
ncbi:MAG TPA: hypothetical protein VLB67_10390 [Acidimicrobiia bacterium]|nr:hypothetical protein [Acidimicrobiia bacterium]